MILSILCIRVRITILTQQLFHVIACTSRIGNLIQTIIVISRRNVCMNGLSLISTTIMNDIKVKTRISIAVRIQLIILRTIIGDRITIYSRECIDQILSWVDSTLTIKRRREIIRLLVQTKIPVISTIGTTATPKNFSRTST